MEKCAFTQLIHDIVLSGKTINKMIINNGLVCLLPQITVVMIKFCVRSDNMIISHHSCRYIC